MSARLMFALVAVLLLASGCGRRIVGPNEVVDELAAFHAAEDLYWEKNPNGSESEFWRSQPEVAGLPRHYRAMVAEMRDAR